MLIRCAKAVRLAAAASGVGSLIEHERGWASIDRVWRDLDAAAARYLHANQTSEAIDVVYAYEDCALHLFAAAKELSLRRVLRSADCVLGDCAAIAEGGGGAISGLGADTGSDAGFRGKLARKTRELELAEVVMCPSNFVRDSLPPGAPPYVVVPFGSPSVMSDSARTGPTDQTNHCASCLPAH